MDESERSYVYGPVPSRRLGLSLGVDVIPFKTCPYDCIYCQLGITTNKTSERRDYVPPDDILRAVENRLKEHPSIDFITLAGSGEPTLHSGLGEIITELKHRTKASVAVITNGSLLWDEKVRKDCCHADLIIPSLDAGDAERFEQINRPCPEISFDAMVKGLIELRKEYRGQYWLEVFLVKGITGLDAEAQKIREIVERIAPDRVQLNTSVRPTAEEYALRVPEEELQALRPLFGSNAEVIARFVQSQKKDPKKTQRDDLLTILSRRPCTMEDLSNGLRASHEEIGSCLEELLADGTAEAVKRDDAVYYVSKRKI